MSGSAPSNSGCDSSSGGSRCSEGARPLYGEAARPHRPRSSKKRTKQPEASHNAREAKRRASGEAQRAEEEARRQALILGELQDGLEPPGATLGAASAQEDAIEVPGELMDALFAAPYGGADDDDGDEPPPLE